MCTRQMGNRNPTASGVLSAAMLWLASCGWTEPAAGPADAARASDTPIDTWAVLAGTGGGMMITASWFVDEKIGWVATNDGSLLVTYDGGDSWRNVRLDERLSSDVITSLQIAKRQDATLYGYAVTRTGRVLRTRDGKTWEIQTALADSLSSVQLVGENSAVARQGRALWRTDDSGETWHQIRPELTGFEEVHYEFAHFRDRLHGMALLRDHDGWRVERTADGGETWIMDNRTWAYDSKQFLTIISLGETTHVYWGAEPLYKSGSIPTDERLIERLLNRKPAGPDLAHLRRWIYVRDEAIFIEEPVPWQRLTGEDLQRSDDRGKSWERKFFPGGFRDTYFVDARHGWIVGQAGKISRTSDGGDTWLHTVLPTTADLRTVFFLDREIGWAGGGLSAPGCVWQTSDGGATWQRLVEIDNGRTGEHSMPETITDIVFRDRMQGWVVTHGMTTEPRDDWRDNASEPREYGRVLHSTDAGQTWKPVYYGAPLSAITRKGNVLIAVGYKVVRTEDGTNWLDSDAPSPLFAVAFADERRVVAVGEQSHVYSSNDLGLTWQLDVHTPITHLDSIAFVSDGFGWMGGSFGTDPHEGLFATSDGGRLWQPCDVAGVRNTGGTQFWKAMSGIDTLHAWTVSQQAVARLNEPDVP